MKRKQFLLSTMASLPAIAFARTRGINTNTSKPFIVRNGNNRSGKSMMKFMGIHLNDVVVSRHDTNNDLSVLIFTGFGIVGTPLHVHYYQDEFFTIVEGKYRFVCGELKTDLSAGDTIFLPRNIPHQWLQLSDNGKLIYIVNPAGGMEDFFQEVDKLKNPTQQELDALSLKHGIKVLGPPLSL